MLSKAPTGAFSASSSSSRQWHSALMLKDFSLKGHVPMHFLAYSYLMEEFLKMKFQIWTPLFDWHLAYSKCNWRANQKERMPRDLLHFHLFWERFIWSSGELHGYTNWICLCCCVKAVQSESDICVMVIHSDLKGVNLMVPLPLIPIQTRVRSPKN